MSTVKQPTIVGLGEALFDVFPDRIVLGGAPLNVAVHAHQLLEALGGGGVVATRVGNDDYGRSIHDQLGARGMETNYVQLDEYRPTGQVRVTISEDEPNYDICAQSAWDAMQFDHRWVRLAKQCDAVCFGTLAQRSAPSREAIQRFLTTAAKAFRLLDVNLRQTYFSRDLLQQSFTLADAAKLNSDELAQVVQLLDMTAASACDEAWLDQQCEELCRRYALRFLARTRGACGTVLYMGGERYETEAVSYPPAVNADAVGAGDACSAGLLAGVMLNWPAERTLQVANHLGAYVASVPGATPVLPESLRAMITH